MYNLDTDILLEAFENDLSKFDQKFKSLKATESD